MRFYPNKRETPAGPMAADLTKMGWLAKFRSILQHDRLVNGVVLMALVIGFFHGWLKLRFRHPATTFLFDAFLNLALVLVFLRLRRGERLFPKCRISKAILAFCGLAVIYALVPSEVPWMARLAGLRAWCFPPLVFTLGYHLTRSAPQAKGYFLVFILLGVITSLYGVVQNPSEIRQRSNEDAYFAKRYLGVYHADTEGQVGVRIFSTFISAGAFGGVMAFCTGLAACAILDRRAGKREKIFLLLAMAAMSNGIYLSGSRSALVMLLISLGVVAWQSRLLAVPIALLVVMTGLYAVGVGGRDAVVSGRFLTLMDKATTWNRFYIPLQAGWNLFAEAPFGTGVGSSGLGVPFFMIERIESRATVFRITEGDIQSIVADMGVPGLALFLFMIGSSLAMVFGVLKKMKSSEAFPVALGCAATILPNLISLPVGSPFIGIPSGPMVWFFVGTVQKLWQLEKEGANETISPPTLHGSRKKFFYYKPEKENH